MKKKRKSMKTWNGESDISDETLSALSKRMIDMFIEYGMTNFDALSWHLACYCSIARDENLGVPAEMAIDALQMAIEEFAASERMH